jgi:hypothetical protein
MQVPSRAGENHNCYTETPVFDGTAVRTGGLMRKRTAFRVFAALALLTIMA